MNPVPRPMVFTAGVALAGACVLGLYLGIQPSLERMSGEAAAPPPSSAAAAMAPGAKTVEATALNTDTPPPSAAPASSAPVETGKPKPRASAADQAPSSDDTALAANAAPAGRKANPPEPPPLYSPDEAPAPPPAGETGGANTPPY